MPTIAPLDLTGHCVIAAYVGEVPFFALADGTVHRLDHGHKWIEVHQGISCAASDRGQDRLLTGGEDGRVVSLDAQSNLTELAQASSRWVDVIAAGPRRAVAWASGKTVNIRLPDGNPVETSLSRSAEGLAFAPKGMRLAVARYNGATLFFPATKGKPAELEWAGAHLGIDFSPNGEFLVTTMQENALHGWKLSDGRHMRMAGYPAKVKSWSWSAKGSWLATSGAPAAIVWPFQGKDGPMGKSPKELGTRGDSLVTAVAFHPTEEFVAIGYDDGMVLACRIADGNEVLLRRPGRGGITSINWHKDGRRLVFGAETGDCGVIDISI